MCTVRRFVRGCFGARLPFSSGLDRDPSELPLRGSSLAIALQGYPPSYSTLTEPSPVPPFALSSPSASWTQGAYSAGTNHWRIEMLEILPSCMCPGDQVLFDRVIDVGIVADADEEQISRLWNAARLEICAKALRVAISRIPGWRRLSYAE